MALCLYANNASSTLAGGISSSATSANLAAGTGALFPSPTGGAYFAMTFQDAATKLIREIVSVTARSTDTVTIVRAQEGTAAVSWLVGDTAANWWTAGSAAALVQVTALQAQAGNYAVDTGTVNSLVAALTPAPTTLTAFIGTPVRIKVLNTNTGNTVLTLTPLAATQIINPDGTALIAGQLVAGGVVTFVYDGSHYYLQTAPYEIPATNNNFTGINTFAQDTTFNAGVTAYLMPNGGQFRAIGGSTGAMLHNDGTNAYLLQTAPGSPLGIYNGFRPFYWNLTSGSVVLDSTGAGTTFGGPVVVNQTLVVDSAATVNGPFYTPSTMTANEVITNYVQNNGSEQINGNLNVSGNITTNTETVLSGLQVNGNMNTSSSANIAGIMTAAYARLGAGAANTGDPNRVMMLNDMNNFTPGGYWIIPIVGRSIYIQFGHIITVNGITTFNFPTPFPLECLTVVISYGSNVNPPSGSVGADVANVGQFTVRDTGGGNHGCYWIALGY